MQLWNIKSSKLIYSFTGWDSGVTVLTQAPAIDVAAVGLADGRIVIHNLRLAPFVRSLSISIWRLMYLISSLNPTNMAFTELLITKSCNNLSPRPPLSPLFSFFSFPSKKRGFDVDDFASWRWSCDEREFPHRWRRCDGVGVDNGFYRHLGFRGEETSWSNGPSSQLCRFVHSLLTGAR